MAEFRTLVLATCPKAMCQVGVVPARGFEPRTFGLKDRCSNQAELRRHEIDCGLRTVIGARSIPAPGQFSRIKSLTPSPFGPRVSAGITGWRTRNPPFDRDVYPLSSDRARIPGGQHKPPRLFRE